MSAAGRVTAVAVATVLVGAGVGFAGGGMVVACGLNDCGPCDVLAGREAEQVWRRPGKVGW